MAQTRLQHDVELIQRGAAAVLAGIVLVAFLVLSVAVAVYDVGKWLAVW
jgi:hypothetical protein